MPKAFPQEFREDVIRVYRGSDASMAQVAKDFGISPSCLKRWLAIDERDSSQLPAGPGLAARSRRCGRRTSGSSCSSRRTRCFVARPPICRRLICREKMYPLVRELAGDGIPVAVTCRVLKIARQPYHRWLACPLTAAELRAAYRANALFDAHRDDPEFGYRFLVEEAREAGESMAERTAWRICSHLGWWSAFGKKRSKNHRATATDPAAAHQRSRGR